MHNEHTTGRIPFYYKPTQVLPSYLQWSYKMDRAKFRIRRSKQVILHVTTT